VLDSIAGFLFYHNVDHFDDHLSFFFLKNDFLKCEHK
jgi:hypothetical protein